MIIPEEKIQQLNSGRYMLGVTGTMGTGKSYTCGQLVKIGQAIGLDVYHIELDKIRIEIFSADPQYSNIRQQLADHFGQHILTQDKSIDRAVFGQILFANKENMRFFKDLVHDTFTSCLEKQKQGKHGLFLVEWALLCQQGFSREVNYNFLVVQCNYEKQITRLMKHNDLPVDQLESRIRMQDLDTEKASIKTLQAMFKKGRLYVFDTSRNPGKRAHANLLEKITRSIL